MDKVTQECVGPQTEEELSAPLSPKRPRTDCEGTDVFDSSVSNEATSSLFSSNQQGTGDEESSIEREDFKYTKPHVQSENTAAYVVDSNSNGAHALSSEMCFISPQSQQPLVCDLDQLSMCVSDGACVSLLPASSATPSVLDCTQLAKPLKENGCLLTGNGEDEEIRCQSHYNYKAAECVTDPCTWSQLAEVKEANLTKEDLEVIENISFREATGESPMPSEGYADFKALNYNPEEDSFGDFAEMGKNEGDIFEPEICGSGRVSICEEQTKSHFNETGSNKCLIPDPAACNKESISSTNMLFETSVVVQSVSLEVDKYSGADQTAEPPTSTGICQEPTERDNDADPLTGSDPAIRSEAEGTHCDSDSAAGTDLSSEQVCEMETPPPLCSDVRTSQKDLSPDQESSDKNEVLCQSLKETGAHLNEIYSMTGSEESFLWKPSSSRSPTKPSSVMNDGVQESHDAQRQEHSQSSCFPSNTEPMMTQRLKCSQTEKDTLCDQSEGEKLKCAEDEGELEPLCDEPNCAIEMEVEEGKGREEMISDGGGNQEIQAKSEVQPEPKDNVSEESPGKGMGGWAEGTRQTFREEEEKLTPTEDMSRSENEEQLLAFSFPSSVAVVPCQQNLIHSENARHNSGAVMCNDRFCPSAFTLRSCVPEGFDTFEKIPLSADDGDGDDEHTVGLGSSPAITSSPRHLSTTPEHQQHTPMAENDEKTPPDEEEVKDGGEEVVERLKRHADTSNGLVSSESAYDESPNFISAADDITLVWPELEPNSGSVCYSPERILSEFALQPEWSALPSESNSPSSGLNYGSEFEMTEQFNRVLKELNLFFEISRNSIEDDCRPSLPEECCQVPKSFEAKAATCTTYPSSPDLEQHQNTPPDGADEDYNMAICGGDSAIPFAAVRNEGEQEVPLDGHPSWETSNDTTEKQRGPLGMDQGRTTWSPSSMYLPLLEQLVQKPPELQRRLEPLKTCTRPIRVGLSKRAKTKNLHHPHPYK